MQSERPVDPFSLPGPLARPARAAQGRTSWRTALSDVWLSLALNRAGAAARTAGRLRDPRHSAVVASRELVRLLTIRAREPESEERALTAAAVALEACAGPQHGAATDDSARTHLLCRLEAEVIAHEQQVLRGDAGYVLAARDAQDVARRIVLVIGAHAGDDRPSGVRAAALEQGLVDLAVLAVRVALNLVRFGAATGPRVAVERGRRQSLVALACELRTAAERACGDCHAAAPLIWTAWSRALSARLPDKQTGELADRTTDRTLRAEALLRVRSAWVRRAAWELVVLDAGAGFGPHARGAQAQQGLVEATARRLAACRLAARPSSFDHQGAWDSDQTALLRALRDFMDTPEPGWSRRDPRVLEPLRANIGRAWMAISLIDAQLGDRPPSSSA
jgi:hypothetical protein